MTVRFLSAPDSETQVRGEIVFEDAPASGKCESPELWGKKGKVALIPGDLHNSNNPNNPDKIMTALVGGGKRGKFSDAVLRDVAAEFTRACGAHSCSRLSLELSLDGEAQKFSRAASGAAAEGALAGAYSFDKYLGKSRKKLPLESFALVGGDEAGLERGRIVGEAESYAKDLCNEPGNVVNPLTFTLLATKLSAQLGLDCSISDEKEIAEAGMNALWSVGKGSATPPRLVHLVYRPEGPARKRVAIVGKGVTFDSGGLCVKTREGIKTMKHDKSGACVMMGVMKAVAELKLPIEVNGIAGLVENMPDGGAYRPDDVIRAMNGKTIEILNTDAEGRLTLADVLTFASKLEPDAILDVATLTGTAKAALGSYTAALLCDDDALSAALVRAAAIAGERLHRLDMDDERLREGLNGVHADLRQASPDGGGTIIGGMFLREFVDPSIPWAHIDIAATGWYDKNFGVYSKGSSAYSLRTIVEYLSSL
ncbi:MAG: leucyl aminopeptidase family protein [Synergistaceae bacterium]|jgi:leucyl aminopeptidase|nr:leucyl aminopeptidase family protein [Synergistaceae bacterium]